MISVSLLKHLKNLPKHSYTKFFVLTPKKTKQNRRIAIKLFLDSTRPNKRKK